jgi:HEAT repeat protein
MYKTQIKEQIKNPSKWHRREAIRSIDKILKGNDPLIENWITIKRDFLEDPDILITLKDCTLDDDWSVRNRAIKILTEFYTQESDLKEIIQNATKDEDYRVRETGLILLAKHYSSCPDTKEIIQDAVKDFNTQNIAIGLLKELG